MAGRIRDEDIALVRERSAVEDVIGEYVALRNAGGGSLKGLCPFHDEKSPSFNVRPARGFWHCFGCGVGGDVIRFVERIEHLSFVEAVERLAARAGVQLRRVGGGSAPVRERGERARLVEANTAAAEYYTGRLADDEAARAREYLTERGFDGDVAARYRLGYAPAGWESLTRYLLGRGFSHRELITAGLAKESRRGGVIDRFHRRLLWPILDLGGDVVGFGARRLFDDDPIEAKYLNTPETPVYKKSQVLYGVDLAKREIARRHQAVVVEGYTDVMACHLAGVPTAVATCGTAFGTDHIAVLRRLLMDSDEFTGEVIFTFDGDEAGRKAALRAFDDDQRFMSQTFVAIEATGKDPCELRQSSGDLAVRDLVARRVPLVAFALRSVLDRYDLNTAEGRVGALERAAPLVARIKDRSLRPEYARTLAGMLTLDDETVRGRIAEFIQGGRAARASRRQPDRDTDARPAPDDPRYKDEREALKLAVQVPVLAGPMFDEIDVAAYTHPTYASIRRAIAAAGGVTAALSGPEWVDKLLAELSDLVAQSVVTELAVEPFISAEEPDAAYGDQQLALVRERQIARQVAELKGRLQRLNPVEHPDEHTALFGELIALEQYKRGLRERALGE